MLLLPLDLFWATSATSWPVPLVGTVPQDIFGNPITVGSTVKLVGIVTAINLSDAHYGEIQVMPTHPGSVGPFISDVQTGSIPQSPNYPFSNPQLTSGPFGFHPKQLVVGT